jgi:hypothetical protein
MENNSIEDDDIYVSSGVGKGRLNGAAWVPSNGDGNPYITVQFQFPTQITGVTVKGESGLYYQSVEMYSTLGGQTDYLDTVCFPFLIASVFYLNLLFDVKTFFLSVIGDQLFRIETI